MNFYIRVEGIDGKTSIPLENLLDKGVTPKTWVCLDNGTDNWDRAENFNELDRLWNTHPKDKDKKENNLPLDISNDSGSSRKPKQEENNLNVVEVNRSKSLLIIIMRMFALAVLMLILYFLTRWFT